MYIRSHKAKLTYYLLTANISSSKVTLYRLLGSVFSNFKTPRGQTDAQMPQPTQDDRMMFCPRWAYHRTSIPISQ